MWIVDIKLNWLKECLDLICSGGVAVDKVFVSATNNNLEIHQQIKDEFEALWLSD